jgi:hypothetical protein
MAVAVGYFDSGGASVLNRLRREQKKFRARQGNVVASLGAMNDNVASLAERVGVSE